jgi:outer membrane protein assembly factor BamB
MRKICFVTLCAAAVSVIVTGADWPMQNGNPQRNGWAKSEHVITKANVAALGLLYKYQADNISHGLNSLTPPIINGNLITYRGFKEMLIFGGSSDKVFSIDADLNKLLWESHLSYQANQAQVQSSTSACPGGLTAPVIMAGSSSSTMHFAAGASRAPAAVGLMPRRPSPYFPPLAQSVYPLRPTTLSQLAAVYAVSSDGELHVINSSTGENLLTPIKFLPPNAKVTSLNIWENVVYATTADNCDGYRNALFALDLLSNEKRVASFVPQSGGFSGTGGTAIGSDGTIYVQVAYRPGDAAGHYHDTILALNPRDLRVKDYFSPPGKFPGREALTSPGVTPLVFSRKGRDLILAGGRNGRLYLLDSKSLGGADHRTPFFQTDPIASIPKHYDGSGFRGTFSSWYDVDSQTRWVYVPLSGPPSGSAKLPITDDIPAGGSILAFKIDGQSEIPALQPLWVSRDIPSPAPAVIANGMIFVLSTGMPSRVAQKNGKPYSISELQKMCTHATVYVFDALTGKELYSTGDKISADSQPGGMALANGRVYVATRDNTVYCFGLLRNQPQLAEQH